MNVLVQVKLEPGLKLIKIFKEHSSKTCILDDFGFYEARQKTIQEKKAKQLQFPKQARLLTLKPSLPCYNLFGLIMSFVVAMNFLLDIS